MAKHGISIFFALLSSIWLGGCLNGQGSGGISSGATAPGGAAASLGSSQSQGSAPAANPQVPAFSGANSPEWAATSPGSIVCPVPEVVAKVQKSDEGGMSPARLCVELKVADTSGSYQSLPNAAWSYRAEYRDSSQAFHELSACGNSLSLWNRSNFDLSAPDTVTTRSLARNGGSATASEIPVVVHIFAVIQNAPHNATDGKPDICENWIPTGEGFRLGFRYSDETGDSWAGERDFAMTPEDVSFDPFLLQKE